MQPPANGTEERLDVLIELLRQQLGQAQVPNNHEGEFDVREPAAAPSRPQLAEAQKMSAAAPVQLPDAGQVAHSPRFFRKDKLKK